MTDDPFADIEPVQPRPRSQKPDRFDKLEQTLEKVVEWIAAKESARPVEPPKVRPARRGTGPVHRPGSQATPSGWPAFQMVLIMILVAVIAFQVFWKPDPDAQSKSDAYARAVASVQIVSDRMAKGLYEIGAEIENGTIKDKQAVGERLKAAIKAALDDASEAQLTALDGIDPWDAATAGKRMLWAADGYSDTAARLKQ